jgi:hypothetical protein
MRQAQGAGRINLKTPKQWGQRLTKLTQRLPFPAHQDKPSSKYTASSSGF